MPIFAISHRFSVSVMLEQFSWVILFQGLLRGCSQAISWSSGQLKAWPGQQIHFLIEFTWFWPSFITWVGWWGCLLFGRWIPPGVIQKRKHRCRPASQKYNFITKYRQSIVPLLSPVRLSVTPWTAARQASLSFTISLRLLKPHVCWVSEAI